MTPAFDLHLMRHGEPEIAGRLLGRTDTAPTADGVALCVARGTQLRVEHLASSDLRRASIAAAAIGDAAALVPTIDPRWRELDFGAWDGCSVADVDPDALGRFWADPEAAPPPGGECWSAIVARVAAAIGDLAARPTLIVTHGGAMRAALAVLCGFALRQLWAFDLPYAALLSLRVWPGDHPVAQVTGLRA